MVDGILSTIPRRIEPLVNMQAFGERRSDGYLPIYKQDGRLWMVLDPDCNSVKLDKRAQPEVTAEELHAKADAGASEHYCYFIAAATGPVKIGYSVDPNKRLAAMQTSSPVTLSILALCKGGRAREAAYHHQFKQDRLSGEWFTRTHALRREIKRLLILEGEALIEAQRINAEVRA